MIDRLSRLDLATGVVAALLIAAMLWAAVQLAPIAIARWF